VDIGPSILGLLNVDTAHQGWGRNLFDRGLMDDGFAVIKAGGENRVGLVKGEYLLIDLPGEEPYLSRYGLGFPPEYSLVPSYREPRRRGIMSRMLRGYVEAGLLALRGRKLGIPKKHYGLEPDTKINEEG
jgi:hypothetical protein